MHDPKHIEKNLQAFTDNLRRKGFEFDADLFLEARARQKASQSELESLQAEKKSHARAFATIAKENGDIESHKAEGAAIQAKIAELKENTYAINSLINTMLMHTPNPIDADVPIGNDEANNVEIRKWGDIPYFEFEVRDHAELGDLANGMDFETAAKISGSRFCVMRGFVAKLHRALSQFMLDMHTQQHGYEECAVPFIVKESSLEGTGQLPKFKDDLFSLEHSKPGYYLIPTAEVPLTNIVRDSILTDAMLPMKFTGHTPCFRSEAGSHGKDTLGLIRQHQFEKVELVQIVRPSDSPAALEELTVHAENVLQALGLPYRTVVLCGGDTGFSAAKTYDIEVWLPSQQTYREISSCSNTRSFQAKRLNARWKNPETGKNEPVHTLNGSGLAVGRTLAAVLENYQNQDGSVTIPEVLKPYMN
ncbi:serine--tRNA ligase [Neptuniibacter sp. QD37_11]|uniref:serine--tRNA ligase n=1 Tax=Neptuniibacter sp. QD37_11 TaxID=3398209 RepID=UPI0039F63550